MCVKIKKIFLCVLCIVTLCGCVNVPSNTETDKLTVVTTIFPIYDFVRAVGGDYVDVKMLINPGSEVHSYDPLPSDMVSIYNSDLFLYIGGESDEWVNTLVSGTEINSIPLIEKVTCKAEHEREHGGHNHVDEHIWTSPDNALQMLDAISAELIKLDAKNENVYENNCELYKSQISEASQKIEDVVSNFSSPYILVADRFPFEYFTEQYGILHDAAFDGCAVSTDISVKTMLRLTDIITQKNVKTVFCTELSNKSIATALKEQLGVEIVELNSAHNVMLDDFNSGITYVDLLYRNAEALERGICNVDNNG